MKKYLIALLCLTFCSIGYAGSKKEIDSFEGMNSSVENGVIIIDYNPGADREKMKRDDAIKHKKNQKRERAIIKQNKLDKKREEVRARSKKSYKRSTQSSSYNKSANKSETKAEWTIKTYNKRLRDLEKKERDHVGPMSKYKFEYFKKRKEEYKQKIRDAQYNPGAYN